MATYPGTERILSAAAEWRERSLLGGESIFRPGTDLWIGAHLDELKRFFVDQPDYSGATFVEKLKGQLAPASAGTKQLAAEMLWVMMLFPNNIGAGAKTDLVAAVWEWSGTGFPREHPLVSEVFRRGIGSGGAGYNRYQPEELTFFVLALRDWRQRPRSEQEQLLADPWRFGAWLDTIPGAQNRQLRHMLLHLLFPEQYERVSSNDNKRRIHASLRDLLDTADLPADAAQNTLVGQDRRLLLIRRMLEAQHPGQRLDFYEPPLRERWLDVEGDVPVPPTPPTPVPPPTVEDYQEPPFAEILARVRAAGLRITEQMLGRYHRSLGTRGFVILSGVSGTGKTWLSQAYADAVGARHLVVPVAPNWTTNEDLLGYHSPITNSYHDTPFSRFLRQAAADHAAAVAAGVRPRPYHLVLDEMNLARVEYYFARFLSVMETRARGGVATIELAPGDDVPLPPTLRFVGTVNVDETTHGFADKVLDRAQLIEMEASRDALAQHLEGLPWAETMLALWNALGEVAPFAYRVLDEIDQYVDLHTLELLGEAWEPRVDEQILQKVLPRVRGTDARLGEALQAVETITAGRFPLSHAKVVRMRDGYRRHGFASYH
jgi:hypothetical protein